jgi:hypothetical protein
MHEALTSDGMWKLLIYPHHAQTADDSVKHAFFEVTLRANVSGLSSFWIGWGGTPSEAIADAFRVKQAEEDRRTVYT